MKQKIKIVCADAIKYMASVKKGEYDYCFADIWEGAEDGADRYIAIKNTKLNCMEQNSLIGSKMR